MHQNPDRSIVEPHFVTAVARPKIHRSCGAPGAIRWRGGLRFIIRARLATTVTPVWPAVAGSQAALSRTEIHANRWWDDKRAQRVRNLRIARVASPKRICCRITNCLPASHTTARGPRGPRSLCQHHFPTHRACRRSSSHKRLCRNGMRPPLHRAAGLLRLAYCLRVKSDSLGALVCESFQPLA